MRKNLKSKTGVTLVALVVTVIILLILAAITINLTIGENGIITTARQAGKNYQEAAENEQAMLAEFWNLTDGTIISAESAQNSVGKGTALESQILSGRTAYVQGKLVVGTMADLSGKTLRTSEVGIDGASAYLTIPTAGYYDEYSKISVDLKELQDIVNVYWVTVGSGDKVPVPRGFYYVGGDLTTGVIISDKVADAYDGVTDKTTHDYAPNLKGNQFVWIPCSVDNYVKDTTFTIANGSSASNANYDTSTNSAELMQIEKYGGFYVARYEAGTSEISEINFSAAYTCTSQWLNPNFVYTKVTSGNVTSKANEIPYYHANYATAVEMSKRMYKNNDYVSSGLITGTMWDVMIKVMNQYTSCSLSSSNWGNYSDYSITDARGKYTYVYDTSSANKGSNTAWADNTAKTNAKTTVNSISCWKLLTTGASNSTQKYHLYDVAGNLSEWTQEMAFNSNTDERFMLRGGYFGVASGSRPASFRASDRATDTDTDQGFRVVLYIK